ncbi:MAG TPA: hypothetical protein VF576_00410 [Rubricoccaceae bacterium]|jgi:CHASE2 domain-containing sensor protein
MLIQRLLQLVVLAIVLMAGLGLLVFVLKLAGWLFGLAIKVLLVLVVAAAVLRFVELVRDKQRRR